MTNPIHDLGNVDPLTRIGVSSPAKPAGPTEARGFKEILLDNLDEVNRLQMEADRKVQALYSGETDDVSDVFTAVNKASIAFDLLMEIRNKLLEAHDEIKQMRV